MGENKKLNISFKNTTRDTQIWMAIQNLEEKSVTIKDILYKALVEKKEFKDD